MGVEVVLRIKSVVCHEESVQPIVLKILDCKHCVISSSSDIILNDEEVVALSKPFNFDHIFDTDVTQYALFQYCKPLVRSTFEQGGNTCILLNGEHGSGKSHAMIGLTKNVNQPDQRGLIFRAAEELFVLLKDSSSSLREFRVCAGLVGFDSCTNAVFDILSEYNLRRAGGHALVSIVEDDKLGTLVTRTRQASGRKSIYVQIEAMHDIYTLLQIFTKVCGRHREWHGCFTLCLDRIHTRGHASNRDLTSAVYKAHARLHFVELVPIIHASNLTQHESSVPIALQQQHNPNLCLNETLSVASVLSGVREVRRNVKSAITSAAHRSSVVQSYRTSSQVYDALADVFLQTVTQDALGIHGHTLLICTTSATASHLNATMVTLRFASRVFMSSHRSVQVRSQPQQPTQSPMHSTLQQRVHALSLARFDDSSMNREESRGDVSISNLSQCNLPNIDCSVLTESASHDDFLDNTKHSDHDIGSDAITGPISIKDITASAMNDGDSFINSRTTIKTRPTIYPSPVLATSFLTTDIKGVIKGASASPMELALARSSLALHLVPLPLGSMAALRTHGVMNTSNKHHESLMSDWLPLSPRIEAPLSTSGFIESSPVLSFQERWALLSDITKVVSEMEHSIALLSGPVPSIQAFHNATFGDKSQRTISNEFENWQSEKDVLLTRLKNQVKTIVHKATVMSQLPSIEFGSHEDWISELKDKAALLEEVYQLRLQLPSSYSQSDKPNISNLGDKMENLTCAFIEMTRLRMETNLWKREFIRLSENNEKTHGSFDNKSLHNQAAGDSLEIPNSTLSFMSHTSPVTVISASSHHLSRLSDCPPQESPSSAARRIIDRYIAPVLTDSNSRVASVLSHTGRDRDHKFTRPASIEDSLMRYTLPSPTVFSASTTVHSPNNEVFVDSPTVLSLSPSRMVHLPALASTTLFEQSSCLTHDISTVGRSINTFIPPISTNHELCDHPQIMESIVSNRCSDESSSVPVSNIPRAAPSAWRQKLNMLTNEVDRKLAATLKRIQISGM